MLRIDLKRWYWDMMLGRQFWHWSYMIISESGFLFVNRTLPSNDDIERFHGTWIHNSKQIVKDFRERRASDD